jgi:protein involved in polysaccharide export with SLBB domain
VEEVTMLDLAKLVRKEGADIVRLRLDEIENRDDLTEILIKDDIDSTEDLNRGEMFDVLIDQYRCGLGYDRMLKHELVKEALDRAEELAAELTEEELD